MVPWDPSPNSRNSGRKLRVEMKIEAIEQHGPDRFQLQVSKMFSHTHVLAPAETDQGVLVLFVLTGWGIETLGREPFRIGKHVGQPGERPLATPWPGCRQARDDLRNARI